MSNAPIIPAGQTLPPLLTDGERDHAARARPAVKTRKGANRFATFNTFIDFTSRTLSRAEVLVWLVLYRDTKPDDTARTSVVDMARRIGANPSTVKRAIKSLGDRGLLVVLYRGTVGRGPSRYRVLALTKESKAPKQDGGRAHG